jgi:hypothetical protein
MEPRARIPLILISPCEVGRVFRQEEQFGAGCAYGSTDGRALVAGEVVGHDVALQRPTAVARHEQNAASNDEVHARGAGLYPS